MDYTHKDRKIKMTAKFFRVTVYRSEILVPTKSVYAESPVVEDGTKYTDSSGWPWCESEGDRLHRSEIQARKEGLQNP